MKRKLGLSSIKSSPSLAIVLPPLGLDVVLWAFKAERLSCSPWTKDPRMRWSTETNQSECRLISCNLLVANESVKLMQKLLGNPITRENHFQSCRVGGGGDGIKRAIRVEREGGYWVLKKIWLIY